MRFSSERLLDDGVLERAFTVDDVPGVLWTPPATDSPAPLVLAGHPGGIDRMHPRLAARARHAAASGFASVSIELPGSGDRPRIDTLDRAREDLRREIGAGRRPDDELVARLVLPLVDRAVPEWQATLDALLRLPGLGPAAGCAGGVLGVGVRLAAVEPRIRAAVLFAGSYVPRSMLAEARRITVPVHVMLQWDDEGNDRQLALDLFDAIGSVEKTLHANTGGHTGIPAFEADAGTRFLARHLA